MRKIMIVVMTLLASPAGFAAGDGVELMDVELDYSMEARMRGAEVAYSVCMSCHNLKYLRWRDLLELGFTQEQVDMFRGEEEKTARLMARSSDEMMKQSFGLVPPDLSLVAKARKGGGKYIYTLFNSYHLAEDGSVDNRLFPGIRMPDVLGFSEPGDDKARKELDGKLRDVTAFMVWASDPHADTRRSIGIWVMIYLFLLTFLLWLYKRRVWSDVPGH